MVEANEEKAARQSSVAEEAPAAVATYIEAEMAAFKESITSSNTTKSIHFYYVGHLLKVTIFLGFFFLIPVKKPTSNILYKMVPVGRNTLAKQTKDIASTASLDGKFTNSSGRKTVILKAYSTIFIRSNKSRYIAQIQLQVTVSGKTTKDVKEAGSVCI